MAIDLRKSLEPLVEAAKKASVTAEILHKDFFWDEASDKLVPNPDNYAYMAVARIARTIVILDLRGLTIFGPEAKFVAELWWKGLEEE